MTYSQFKKCYEALLLLWMENIIKDREYYEITDALNSRFKTKLDMERMACDEI